MRIGCIARQENSGLSNLTWEFSKAIKPDKTLVVDLSHFRKVTNYPERYPNAITIKDDPTQSKTADTPYMRINTKLIDEFLEGLDVVYSAENFYTRYITRKAKELGIKTFLHYMYEYFNNDNLPVFEADIFLAPSKWHLEDVKKKLGQTNIIRYLPIPVNRELCKFKLRTKAKRFLHIMGRQTDEDRNGTQIVLDAIPRVQDPDIEFIIRTQGQVPQINDPRVTIETEAKNYWDMYDADVLLMPRRFGGLCLPLNEAMSCGLVPIMTDISPQNKFLPMECLVRHEKVKNIQLWNVIQQYDVDPRDLADKIDSFAMTDISYFSNEINKIVEQISWNNMRNKYLETFRELC